METKQHLEKQVMMAARDQGVSAVLFRNAIARALGLNITDSECLSFLSLQNGTSTPTDIARYTGLTTGSTTTMLDRLEKAGFIARKPNPTDRRGIIVTLNKQWMNRAGPLVAGVQMAHKELLASYSPEELVTIADFLTRFTQNVTQQTTIIEQK